MHELSEKDFPEHVPHNFHNGKLYFYVSSNLNRTAEDRTY